MRRRARCITFNQKKKKKNCDSEPDGITITRAFLRRVKVKGGVLPSWMDVRGEIESLRRSPNEKERAKEKKVEAISKLERKPVDA